MSDDLVTAFPPYYDEVPMSRGTAGWENPPYYLTAYGLAVKHGYTGTEEEWLASLKGDPGFGIIILGHYDTLAELEEDVTDPEDGEMYDVGSGAGQLVYYWCGDEWLPLNVHGPQGETGPAGQDGAPGVDGADGASAYEQAVEAGYSGTEAQFTQLLADLPGYTEQARLWAVAAGEAETAAEGYAEAAAESAASVDMTNYVPKTRKVNGKELSADVSLSARDVKAQEPIDYDSIVFPLSWSGSGPYTEIVTTVNAEVEDEAIVSLMPTPAQLAQLTADGVTALIVENNMGTLTAYALGAAPTTAMTMGCTLTLIHSNIIH